MDLSWVSEVDWMAVAGVAALVVVAGERVSQLTKTKADDKVFGVVHKLFATVGLDVRDMADKQLAAKKETETNAK